MCHTHTVLMYMEWCTVKIRDQKHTCVCVSVKYWLDLVAQHLCGVWCATHGIVYNPLL